MPVTDQMFHPRQQHNFNTRANLIGRAEPEVRPHGNAAFGKSDGNIEVDNSSIIGLLYAQQSGFGWKGVRPARRRRAAA